VRGQGEGGGREKGQSVHSKNSPNGGMDQNYIKKPYAAKVGGGKEVGGVEKEPNGKGKRVKKIEPEEQSAREVHVKKNPTT